MRRCLNRVLWLGISLVLGAAGCSERVLDTAVNHTTFGDESSPDVTCVNAPMAIPAAAADPAGIPVPVPETADAALRVIIQGLHENHPDVLWDSLPASYQRDVNELVHLFANRLHPEAWRWFLQIASKGAGRVRFLSTVLAGSYRHDATVVEGLKTFESCAVELERLSQSGPVGLERLKSADVGGILRNEGRRLMPELRSLLKAVDGSVLPAFLDDPAIIRAELKSFSGDATTVEFETPGSDADEIEFVRVEGKWIPLALAEGWQTAIDAAQTALLDAMPSPNAIDNFGVPFQILAIADFWMKPLPDSDVGCMWGEFLKDVVPSFYQSMILLGYMIGGPPTVDPDFHQKTKQTLDGKNKLTLVYCYASKELKWDNESVDFDLAKHVAHQLNGKKIKVVDPDRVYAWLDKHSDWRKTSEMGAAFKADYIVHIDLKDYSLTEANTNNLYRGSAECIVNVVQMDENKRDGHVIYTVPIKSMFPKNAPVDQSAMPYSEFKKRYLSALSYEIGKLFFSTETGDDIPYSTLQQ